MRTIIITGLSGAGKTQAIDCLEDMGYYCIDNMPPALIRSFIQLTSTGKDIEQAAFVVDVRSRQFFEDFNQAIQEFDQLEIDYKILYLEASDQVLLRRYNETRRTHPLSEGGSVRSGLEREKKMLEPIRKAADYIIDTSNMKTAQFWGELRDIVLSDENEKTFMVSITSFGFKHGTPLSTDMIFDTRFIPNPYYVQSLRKLTGNNQKVSHYVLKHEITQKFLDGVVGMVNMLAPYYMKEGKYSLSIGIGCTGGHHRSVACANELHRRLRESGHRVSLEHRDL
ncbi:MAG: RNase adapter RapZ [Firmicutes bacterium]|nr:RNase adapter RapZ [Bacillota bacterium]